MADEIAEELAHQELMDELRHLSEQIFMRMLFTNDATRLKHEYDDIVVFGDEPMFASVLLDKVLKESDESH